MLYRDLKWIITNAEYLENWNAHRLSCTLLLGAAHEGSCDLWVYSYKYDNLPRSSILSISLAPVSTPVLDIFLCMGFCTLHTEHLFRLYLCK